MATLFQDELVESVERLADEIGAIRDRQLVHGESEEYFVIRLEHGKITLDVYVYFDEAGFYKDEDWHLYERCDFDSHAELKISILSDLARALGSTGRESSEVGGATAIKE